MRGRRLLITARALGVALGLSACASTTSETAVPGEAAAESRDAAEDATATVPENTEPVTADDSEMSATRDDAIVVLSGPDRREPGEPVTLVEAAVAARAQRAATGPPAAAITDRTITEATRGEPPERGTLTYATAPGAKATRARASTGATEETPAAAQRTGESYWRTTVRDARLRWRDASRRVEDLQARVAELRNAFYATDDPAYRDGVVKLDWDAAASELATAEAEVVAAREDLRRRLDAGRRAGALPGWLREGLELEPDPREERGAAAGEPSIAEPVEPPAAEEEGPP